ncbi:MAG TPA: hypothetical protein VGW78_03890 [Candidatus Babeliales bacterium]|nr:hypothetical protein [Candidatus Babeliales bacterium]
MKRNTNLILICTIFYSVHTVIGMETNTKNKTEKFRPLKLNLDALQSLFPSDFGVQDIDSLWSKVHTLHHESFKQEQATKNMSWKEYMLSGFAAQTFIQPSPLDQALLKFARTMSNKEKKWESWHMISIDDIQKKPIYLIFDESDFMHTFGEKLDKNNAPIPNANPSEILGTIGIRCDMNSPYYRPIAEPNQKLQELNVIENRLYHDALKSMIRKRHRLSLQAVIEEEKYNAQKNLFINEIKELQSDEGYQKFAQSCAKNVPQEYIHMQYQDACKKLQTKLHASDQYYVILDNITKEKELLKKELKKFKSPQGRVRFTRSSMNSATFHTIQSLRDAYQAQNNDVV